MAAVEMPTLKAQSRAPAGKGEARRLRRTGFVPAIAYGKGLPSTPIAVVPKEVAVILKSERGQNTVLQLELDGKKLLAMIRDFSVHPVKRALEHVDFIEVKLDKPVDVEVPLFSTGKPVGVTKGGVLRIVLPHRSRSMPARSHPGKNRGGRHAPRARPARRHPRPQAPRRGFRAAPRRANARRGRRAGEGSRRSGRPWRRGCGAGRGLGGSGGRCACSGRRCGGQDGAGEGRQEEEVVVFLVVGLGNPGREYENSRHNVGFVVADEVKRLHGWPDYKQKFSGLWTRGSLEGHEVVLLKPQTYMNLSGNSVQPAAAFFKVPPEQIVVAHDELDLPWRDVRLKMGGGHAGNNGIRSIIQRSGRPTSCASVWASASRPPASEERAPIGSSRTSTGSNGPNSPKSSLGRPTPFAASPRSERRPP